MLGATMRLAEHGAPPARAQGRRGTAAGDAAEADEGAGGIAALAAEPRAADHRFPVRHRPDGGVGQLGGLAGGVFGGDMGAGCNLLHFFQAGSIIDDQIQLADNGAVAMSVSAMATVFGDTVVDEQFATGDWASLGLDEVRGYVGWGMETTDGTNFGWMDIGWDGEVLSIYDWAFSTNGSL